jgi:hypothetical protein
VDATLDLTVHEHGADQPAAALLQAPGQAAPEHVAPSLPHAPGHGHGGVDAARLHQAMNEQMQMQQVMLLLQMQMKMQEMINTIHMNGLSASSKLLDK